METNPTPAPESADESGEIRPFVDTLRALERGEVLERLDVLQHKIVAAVEETHRGGSITITLAYQIAGKGQMAIRATVKGKAPEEPPAQSLFFVDDVGNLTREDPRQRSMFEERRD